MAAAETALVRLDTADLRRLTNLSQALATEEDILLKPRTVRRLVPHRSAWEPSGDARRLLSVRHMQDRSNWVKTAAGMSRLAEVTRQQSQDAELDLWGVDETGVEPSPAAHLMTVESLLEVHRRSAGRYPS